MINITTFQIVSWNSVTFFFSNRATFSWYYEFFLKIPQLSQSITTFLFKTDLFFGRNKYDILEKILWLFLKMYNDFE